VPSIMMLVRRLEQVKIIPEMDWFLDWSDLTEASMAEKIDRATKMADTNQKMGTTTYVFTDDEIRAAVGYEPLTDAQKYRDDVTDDEQDAALGKTPSQEKE
jgi:hypothetical protein